MGSGTILHKQTDYLSHENTNCLKGICAIGVLAHHLYQDSGLLREGYLWYLGQCFQALGFLMVAIFFFLSGYGLFQSTKRKTMIEGFIKNKILPFYLIIVFYTIVYAMYSLACQSTLDWLLILKSLTFGGTIIANGWYLQVQLLCYLMFFFVMKFVNERYQILTLTALQVVYIVVCLFVGLSSLYYERSFIFVMGIIWAKYKDKIDNWLSDKVHFYVTLFLSVFLFIGLYCLSYIMFHELTRGLSYFPFIIVVVLLLKITPISFSFTRFLGKISLEIYVLQGIFMLLFHGNMCYIDNPYLFVLVVCACTIVSAIIMHPISKVIYSLTRKMKGNIG